MKYLLIILLVAAGDKVHAASALLQDGVYVLTDAVMDSGEMVASAVFIQVTNTPDGFTFEPVGKDDYVRGTGTYHEGGSVRLVYKADEDHVIVYASTYREGNHIMGKLEETLDGEKTAGAFVLRLLPKQKASSQK